MFGRSISELIIFVSQTFSNSKSLTLRFSSTRASFELSPRNGQCCACACCGPRPTILELRRFRVRGWDSTTAPSEQPALISFGMKPRPARRRRPSSLQMVMRTRFMHSGDLVDANDHHDHLTEWKSAAPSVAGPPARNETNLLPASTDFAAKTAPFFQDRVRIERADRQEPRAAWRSAARKSNAKKSSFCGRGEKQMAGFTI